MVSYICCMSSKSTFSSVLSVSPVPYAPLFMEVYTPVQAYTVLNLLNIYWALLCFFCCHMLQGWWFKQSAQYSTHGQCQYIYKKKHQSIYNWILFLPLHSIRPSHNAIPYKIRQKQCLLRMTLGTTSKVTGCNGPHTHSTASKTFFFFRNGIASTGREKRTHALIFPFTVHNQTASANICTCPSRRLPQKARAFVSFHASLVILNYCSLYDLSNIHFFLCGTYLYTWS